MNARLPIEALPEVAAFLGQSPLSGVIGGEDVMASNGAVFCTRDPGSGQPLAEVAAMQADDVDRAVQAAQQAFDTTGWPRLQPNERGVLLHRLADAVESRKTIMAQIESLDAGKIPAQAEWDVQNFVNTLRYYTDMALARPAPQPVGRRRPRGLDGAAAVGTVRVYLPLEFSHAADGLEPFARPGRRQHGGGQAGRGHAAVGDLPGPAGPRSRHSRRRDQRRARLRRSGRRGLGVTSGAAADVVHRLARGGPPDGRRLRAEPRAGEAGTGRQRRGGDFRRRDLPRTVEALAGDHVPCRPGLLHATRWLVHRSIYEQFVAASVERLRQCKIGYQLDPATELGPVVSREAARSGCWAICGAGAKKGAEVLLEGGPQEVPGREGYYVKPALLAGSLDNVAAREEIFGPVAYLAPFHDEAEAVGLVNRPTTAWPTASGPTDLDRANRVAEAMVAGNSWINAHNVFPHGVPYAG